MYKSVHINLPVIEWAIDISIVNIQVKFTSSHCSDRIKVLEKLYTDSQLIFHFNAPLISKLGVYTG